MPDSPQRDELLNLFNSVRSKYDELLRDFDEDESYIRGDYVNGLLPDSWADEGLKDPIRLTTITDALDNATDHILTFPRIDVPVRPTEDDVERQRQIAENKRHFLDMWWDRVFQEQGDPLGRGKKQLVKGKMVLKKEIDWNLIPLPPESNSKRAKEKYRRDVEKVGKTRFIWRLRVVPKETVFEDLDSPHDPQFVFEHFQITVMEAKRRFPHANIRNVETRDQMERIDYLEYWSKPQGDDPGMYVQWLDEERVHESENPYAWETPLSTRRNPDYDGYVPYVITDPGWGDTDAENKPFDRYVSLTRHMRSLALSEARQLTAVEAALRMAVWSPIVGKNMGDVEEGEKVLRVGPGAFWNLSEDQDISTLDMRDVPVGAFQYLAKVQQETDRHSKFGALGGAPQRGVDTATEADQNARNAATKLSGPIRAMRRAVLTINKWVLQDIDKVLEVPVTLYGALEHGPSEVTIGPRAIAGFYYTNVQMETSDEAALNLRNARTWSDLAQRLPISFHTAMQKAGISNPQAEIDERILENLEQSPQALQLMLSMMLAAFETSPEGLAVKQAFQQTLAQQNASGGGGGQNGQQPNQPDTQNPVEALRQTTRNEAIQNQPERSFF